MDKSYVYVVMRQEDLYETMESPVLAYFDKESAEAYTKKTSARAEEIIEYRKKVLEENDWTWPEGLERPKNEYDVESDAYSNFICYYVMRVEVCSK